MRIYHSVECSAPVKGCQGEPVEALIMVAKRRITYQRTGSESLQVRQLAKETKQRVVSPQLRMLKVEEGHQIMGRLFGLNFPKGHEGQMLV